MQHDPQNPVAHGAGYAEPSESGLALTLGLLTFILPVLGPFAWFFGQREVRAIDAGRRDPANRTKANIGRLIGMVATIAAAVVLAIVIFVVVLGINNR